jgi:hypothetical protein
MNSAALIFAVFLAILIIYFSRMAKKESREPIFPYMRIVAAYGGYNKQLNSSA